MPGLKIRQIGNSQGVPLTEDLFGEANARLGKEVIATVKSNGVIELRPISPAAEVMRRDDMCSSLYHAWRKQALTAAAAAGFAAAQIAAPTGAPPPPPANRIEIETASGTRVSIEGAVDPRVLGAVLKAIC